MTGEGPSLPAGQALLVCVGHTPLVELSPGEFKNSQKVALPKPAIQM